MEIKYGKKQPIGTTFKKENIYLGTLVKNNNCLEELAKDRTDILSDDYFKSLPDNILEALFASVIPEIETEEIDIFYKDETGYTYFNNFGILTLKGDNSDGKGILKNIVPVWDYYNEEDIFEVMANDQYFMIGTSNINPLMAYDNDYNKDITNKSRIKK